MLAFGRSREFFELTLRYDGRCFACRETISAGTRCFAAQPGSRRTRWNYCCWTCALEKGWVADRKPEKVYEAPPGGWWWNRYGG